MRGFKALLLLVALVALVAAVAAALLFFAFRPTVEYAYGTVVPAGPVQASFPWPLAVMAALAALALFAFWRAIYIWLARPSR